MTAKKIMGYPGNMEEVIKESGKYWMESITMLCSSDLWCTQRSSTDFHDKAGHWCLLCW